MKLQNHIDDWDQLAKKPVWAILTGQPDLSLDEFFATGESEIQEFWSKALQLGFPKQRQRALDFGCGMGRLTRQLAKHFSETWGVDVSDRMLQLAAQHNPSLHFQRIEDTALPEFPNDHFDLVYTILVLQHQPNRAAVEAYLRSFIRILRPGGLLAFQLPSKMPFRYWLAPRRRAYKLLHGLGVSGDQLQKWNLFPMKMTAVSPERVLAVLQSQGAELLRSEPHPGSNPIPSMMYFFTRK